MDLTPRQKKAMSMPDVRTTASRDQWKKVLTQSNQEMLRELALQATQAAVDASKGRTVEQIAAEVAERMLDKAFAVRLLADGSGMEPEDAAEGDAASEASEDRLLEDLEAVPWNIWSGAWGVDEEPAASSSNFGDSASPPRLVLSPPDLARAEATRQVNFAMDEPADAAASVSALTKVRQPPKRRDWETPPVTPKAGAARSTSMPFDSKLFDLRSSVAAVRQAGVRPSSDASQCGATMSAGLQLLTTTREHTFMQWHDRPQTVLVVAKPGDADVAKRLREITVWLDSQGVTVLVEPKLLREIRLGDAEPKPCGCRGACECTKSRFISVPRRSKAADQLEWGWGSNAGLPTGCVQRLRTFTPHDDLELAVDLVICLGGDGSLCWAAGLFQRGMPPVLAFAGGSLGFLTPFNMDDWLQVLMPILGATCDMKPLRVACRMRFQMKVIRAGEEDEEQRHEPFQALNEVLVHRGSYGGLCKLEIWIGKTRVTMVQADGLIVATPTGSTAYSLAAGGSMLQPSVPGIILTPVCPHSLSFRPVVLPDSAVVTVRVPLSSRSNKVPVSVDGKDRIMLARGDAIEISVSNFPLPTLCKSSVTEDWFQSVNEALQWNMRLEQKGLAAPPQV